MSILKNLSQAINNASDILKTKSMEQAAKIADKIQEKTMTQVETKVIPTLDVVDYSRVNELFKNADSRTRKLLKLIDETGNNDVKFNLVAPTLEDLNEVTVSKNLYALKKHLNSIIDKEIL